MALAVAGFAASALLVVGLLAMASTAQAQTTTGPTQLAELALACLHSEYPNKISHVMSSDADLAPPRKLTPAFFGCYDWHSAVHGHWLLVRLARQHPRAAFAADAHAALDRSLTPANIAAELEYFRHPGRASFERPYGLAWLLQLAAELAEWKHADAQRWSETLAPLEREAADRIAAWLEKLTYPIRTGEHSQTAFAFGLVLDWARSRGDARLEKLLVDSTRRFYLEDRACPLAYEPSGQDFLSPCLAEADLVRRVISGPDYDQWLTQFLPNLPAGKTERVWLPVAEVSDRADPKLAHLDGLNISRAWMLEGIAAGCSSGNPRRRALLEAAQRHRDAGLAAVTGEYYEGGHWLGSFATYLVTGRGLPAQKRETP